MSHSEIEEVSATLPRVFLVDDHELFRAGVRNELGSSVSIVGEADDVGPAIELISSAILTWSCSTCISPEAGASSSWKP